MKIYVVILYLLMFACSTFAQSNYSGNIYQNPKIGLMLEKPQDWLFVSAQQSLRNRENTELLNEQLEQDIRNEANLPTVSIAKYPEPHPTVNPTVQIRHIVKRSPELKPVDVLKAVIAQMQNGLKDFELTEPIQTVIVSEHKAAWMEAGFTMQTKAGGTFDVHSRMWVVERGEEFFIIGMSGPAEGKDVSEEEFASILSNIRIKR